MSENVKRLDIGESLSPPNDRALRARLIEQTGGETPDRRDVHGRKCSSSVDHAMIVDCGNEFDYGMH